METRISKDDILERAIDRRTLCRVLSRAHIIVSTHWSSAHLYIGLPNAVFASVIGVQALADLTDVKLVLGLLSSLVAVLTALITFLNPNEKAQTHLNASRLYEQVGDKYDALILKGTLNLKSEITEYLEALSYLNEEYSNAKKTLPMTPEWAYQQAAKRFKAEEESIYSRKPASSTLP